MPGAVLSLMRCLARRLTLAAAAAAALGVAAAELPPLVEGNQLGRGWRVVTLPNQAMPATRFTPQLDATGAVLQVQADRSYGNLVQTLLPPQPSPEALAWRWRLLQPGHQPRLRSKDGDDTPIKVCLSFDMPMSQVPFVERQLLRLARSRSGEDLPTATLCWVWGGAEAAGSVIENPYTRRVRYVVLRNGSDEVGSWLDERVAVAQDFARAFGDESATVPPVTAVIVAGDADNTGGHSVAQITGLRLEP